MVNRSVVVNITSKNKNTNKMNSNNLQVRKSELESPTPFNRDTNSKTSLNTPVMKYFVKAKTNVAGTQKDKITRNRSQNSSNGEISDDIEEGDKQIDKMSSIYVGNASEYMTLRSEKYSRISVFKAPAMGVFDESSHPMQLKFVTVNASTPSNKIEEMNCYLCLDEIDPVFGYYSCTQCKIEMCRECAVYRNKCDFDIAENPNMIATNFDDIVDGARADNEGFIETIVQ
jgi:hypothetical protein